MIIAAAPQSIRRKGPKSMITWYLCPHCFARARTQKQGMEDHIQDVHDFEGTTKHCCPFCHAAAYAEPGWIKGKHETLCPKNPQHQKGYTGDDRVWDEEKKELSPPKDDSQNGASSSTPLPHHRGPYTVTLNPSEVDSTSVTSPGLHYQRSVTPYLQHQSTFASPILPCGCDTAFSQHGCQWHDREPIAKPTSPSSQQSLGRIAGNARLSRRKMRIYQGF